MPVGDPAPPGDADPLIGKIVSDRYRILRKIGQGGMGVVYLSEHALIEKKMALKVLFPELTRRGDLVARFLQEAKSASRIGHENVIDISDFGQMPDGLVYIAMEYLDGVDLGHILRTQGALKWARARPILMQIAKGLRAAHEHGIIHRDMKPENIFVTQREGRPDFVKVLDFGIAKVVDTDGDGPRLTQAGAIFGTPEYMSPEQAQGQPSDHRVDIYALGCIMYQALTGAVPFHADSFMGILAKHMLEPVIPPRQRRPDLDISEEIEMIAMRALEKDREKRWPDMDAFYRALGAAGDAHPEWSANDLPRASLKYPVLAQSNPQVRLARTELFTSGDRAPGLDFPVANAAADSLVPPRSVPTKVIVGAGAAVLLVAILVAILATRSSDHERAAAPASGEPPRSPIAATAMPVAAPPPPPAAVAVPPPPATEPTATPAPATVVTPPVRRATRPAHPRGPAEGGKPAGNDPSNSAPTPPELKNPFSSP